MGWSEIVLSWLPVLVTGGGWVVIWRFVATTTNKRIDDLAAATKAQGESLTAAIKAQGEAVNKRIDDQAAATNQRIDDLRDDVREIRTGSPRDASIVTGA